LRIIYTFVKGKRIVLLHGFIKKSQKTPREEIKIAQKYLGDFQKEKNRYGKNKF
jgi:phage-related protein